LPINRSRTKRAAARLRTPRFVVGLPAAKW
jgi:hypothetical protein